jgi:3-oxoacyl-[acyl-carrier protein] reductase
MSTVIAGTHPSLGKPRSEWGTQQFSPRLLAGKVAVVTGASRGIGRATAFRLAEAGARVVVNYRSDEQSARALCGELLDIGAESFAFRADCAQPDEGRALISSAADEFGGVDLVVANAGIWEGAPIAQLDEELWDRVIDVNLKGTWSVCHAAAPQLKKRGGNIVIVSSTAGQRGEAGYSNYAASKGGQISFAKSLATELAPDVRVNCVAPGWVDTELNDPVFGDTAYKRTVADNIPLRRIATADDVACSIVFLASDLARHITGEVLNVNGGAVLCG